jgi:hypothetical protein
MKNLTRELSDLVEKIKSESYEEGFRDGIFHLKRRLKEEQVKYVKISHEVVNFIDAFLKEEA